MSTTTSMLAAAAAIALLVACSHERLVHETRSEYQRILVGERNGIRTLRFGTRRSPVQSKAQIGRPEVLLVPYIRASLVGLTFVNQPQRILVVGLGGGSLPAYLHLALPETQIDVAELDPEVVRVAEEWFDVVPDERLRLHAADGRRFIEQVGAEVARGEGEPYDLIFLDAYGRNSVPEALTTLEFLEAVQAALSPDGVVVANIWNERTNPLYPSMLRTYQEAFDELFAFPVPRRNNHIVVGAPRRIGLAAGQLEQSLADWTQWLPGDQRLTEVVPTQSVRVTGREFQGDVLHDAGE